MARRCRSLMALGICAACLWPAEIAIGSETITYAYDARGQLVRVDRSGTVNNGTSACYSYDKVNNRTNVAIATGNCGIAPASFSVNDIAVTEGATMTFTVTKTGTTSSSLSVTYATSNGSATAGSDFMAANGTLTFAANETSKPVSITTTDDSAVESAETLTLTLSGPTGGATLSDATGAGTINDNDGAAPSSFAVNNVSAFEGGLLQFVVTRSGGNSTAQSVTVWTSHGTAGSTDYSALSPTQITFAIGETVKSVNIATIDNAIFEANETMYLNLGSPTNGATISDNQGAGSIYDNDEEGGGGGCPPSGCP